MHLSANQEADLRSTARRALLVAWSLLAWFGEAILLYDLWSARNSPHGVTASLYLLPIAHLLPLVRRYPAAAKVDARRQAGGPELCGGK